MTLEEQIEDLKAQVEATNLKNRELIVENRKLNSKNKELDFDTYNKVIEENDLLKSDLTKIKNELGLKTKEFDNISNKLNEKESYLKNLTLENSLNEHLSKIGVKPEYMTAAKALLEKNAKVDENGVLIGDKNISDFIHEWSNNEGKIFINAPANSGGGATGSNGTGASVQKRSEMTHAQKGEYIKANGQDAYLKLPN